MKKIESTTIQIFIFLLLKKHTIKLYLLYKRLKNNEIKSKKFS